MGEWGVGPKVGPKEQSFKFQWRSGSSKNVFQRYLLLEDSGTSTILVQLHKEACRTSW